MDYAPPIALGRHQLDRVRGRGSFGVVFESFDGELERDVAIKVFAVPNPSMHEARTLARLNHPHVVTLHDVGHEDGFTYLVFELIDGWTLRQLARTELDWRGWVELFVQAGRGLAAAHRANIAHGDIKPGNILVGRDGRVRVIDFGLARSLADPDRERRSTYGGTPQYRAPECWAGELVDEQRADQFSFCASLWEALYRRRPWESTKPLATRAVDPTKAQPDPAVPPCLEHAIRRGLARDPADRYPNMDSLLGELELAISVHSHVHREAS